GGRGGRGGGNRRRASISLLGGGEVAPAPPKENERVPWKARPWERFGAARRGPESQRWRGSTRLQGKTGEPLGDFRKVWVASCATAKVPGSSSTISAARRSATWCGPASPSASRSPSPGTTRRLRPLQHR